MNILSIETSCDETAVSVISANGGLVEPYFDVLGNALFSQIEMHKEYGGVFPTVAKREHAKKLPHLLTEALKEASLFISSHVDYSENKWQEIEKILAREDDLFLNLKKVFENIEKPNIDMIAVTAGPGLEPALWVGISCAKALGLLWDIPVIPTNHMEGHILSVFLEGNIVSTTKFPALALLISGGHTELVEIQNWGEYKIVGQTRDDAVGEAFDKVARMLGLPYPGGPEISRLAEGARNSNLPQNVKLPRPMIHSDNLDFSFSGLKTAVLYYIRDHGDLSDNDKADIAREFEDAVVEVLVQKTRRAIENSSAQTLIIAGGVIANKMIKKSFHELEKEYPDLTVKTPTHAHSTDNALMIAIAGYMTAMRSPELLNLENIITANGNMRLS